MSIPFSSVDFSVCLPSICPMPAVNMIGLRNPHRSPFSRRMSNERVNPRMRGSPNLFPVIRGPVTRFNLNLQTFGKVVRNRKVTLPLQLISREYSDCRRSTPQFQQSQSLPSRWPVRLGFVPPSPFQPLERALPPLGNCGFLL